MEETRRAMTISELSSISKIPLSTIKFYIREGLVPGPKKSRGTRAYYGAGHLHRLRLIRKIQTEGNLPLSKMKEIISMIEDSERARGKAGSEASAAVRNEIIASATQVFREKGYEKATIADIVAAARIGRSTFYKRFRDKKDLFIECIKQIIFREMNKGEPDEVDEIRDEEDILRVFDRHAKAYYNVNPLWIDMVNQLRAAAINAPQEFAGELEEVIHLKINLLKRGLEKGIRRGLFREINPTLMAVMLLGLQDYHDYLSKDADGKSLEEKYNEATDIILYGILKRRTKPDAGGC
jgi:AcrR family transcriptional regulator